MSHATVIDNDSGPARPGMTIPVSARWKQSPWIWAAIACVLLGSSAVGRAVQDRRHKDESSYLESCPFPLEKIPSTLGVWKLLPGGDSRLDSMTMRITGGTDHILRTYMDDFTGVRLVVLVLFGPAEPVLPHTPEACYPANGFTKAEDPMVRTIKYASKDASGREIEGNATFRSAVYQKPGGRSILRQGVYHSFRLDGQWSPDIGAGRKFPRRNPGLFKVQVQRMVAEGERRGDDKVIDPIEQFLSALIPEIEREIGAAAGKDLAAK